jgi:uncharacterized protein (DUF1499 family)
MMKLNGAMGWAPAAILVALALWATVSCASQRRPKAGMADGRLKPCPDSPNCVCSEDRGGRSSIEPLAFVGSPADAWSRAKQALQDMGGKIQEEKDGYLWATFTSRIFRFVDDLEVRMDAANQVIHVRSASRVGYSDLGVNRKRVEALRVKFGQER